MKPFRRIPNLFADLLNTSYVGECYEGTHWPYAGKLYVVVRHVPSIELMQLMNDETNSDRYIDANGREWKLKHIELFDLDMIEFEDDQTDL